MNQSDVCFSITLSFTSNSILLINRKPILSPQAQQLIALLPDPNSPGISVNLPIGGKLIFKYAFPIKSAISPILQVTRLPKSGLILNCCGIDSDTKLVCVLYIVLKYVTVGFL